MKSDSFERIYELTRSRNIDLRKESLYVILNAITGADLQVCQQIYEKTGDAILDTLINALNLTQDLKLLSNTLEAIESIIKMDDWFGYTGTENSIAKAFEDKGGVAELEEVAKHPNIDIYNRVNELLNKFFFDSINQDGMDIGDSNLNGGPGQYSQQNISMSGTGG